MKKHISMLLCTAALLLGFNVPTALAASSPYYPISVEQYTYGSFDEVNHSLGYNNKRPTLA